MNSKKTSDIKPIILCGSFRKGAAFVFNTSIGPVTLRKMDKLIKIFLRHANGLNTIKNISSTTSESERILYQAFEILKQYKIAEDSRNIYRWFHSLTLSESPYRQHISLGFINSLKAMRRKPKKEVKVSKGTKKIWTVDRFRR